MSDNPIPVTAKDSDPDIALTTGEITYPAIRRVLMLFVVCTLVSTIFSLLIFFGGSTEVGAATSGWWRTQAIWYFVHGYLWVAISPALRALERALPVTGRKAARNITIHVACVSVLAPTHMFISILLDHWLQADRGQSVATIFRNEYSVMVPVRLIIYGLLVLGFACERSYRQMRLEERRAATLQVQLAHAQLQALRAQIQPHFLFNALHSISCLIYESRGDALTMIARLGELLRATLERSSSQTIRLEQELHFTQLYLAIEGVRFGERLRVMQNVAAETLAVEVPTLILQPLVENAVRHGVGATTGPVELRIEAARHGPCLQISLRNCALSQAATVAHPKASGGMGILNTRARLSSMYGGRASLSCKALAPGHFCVTMEIPASMEAVC